MTSTRVEVQPAELARLLDLAERPRHDGWSLRAALTRYAQPQPQRASDVIELVRRIEFAVRPHMELLQRDGPALWAAATTDDADDTTDAADAADTAARVDDAQPFVVELLRAMVQLDGLGDALATWAHDRKPERPDVLVDTVTAEVARRLERLGVAREERPPRPSGRAGRGV